MKVKEKIKSLTARAALHLCILLGAISITMEKAPHIFSSNPDISSSPLPQELNSDQLLAAAISESQQKPSVLKASKEEGEKKETKVAETFEDILNVKWPSRAGQLVKSFSADKLALWSVFSNLSTYSGLNDILNQPIKAYERETLRSESFNLTAGFDQIIYKIHLESGGTSLVVAQVEGDSVLVSLYKSPAEMGMSYQVQRFKDGLWVESSELLRAQVDGEVLQAKNGSAVVLSASVGM